MRKKLDRATKTLEREILEGDYKPGDRLPSERTLSLRYGVSRSILREGIRHLAGLGLVRWLDGGAEVPINSTDRLRARVGQPWQQEMERVPARLGATGGVLHLLSQDRLVKKLARALV